MTSITICRSDYQTEAEYRRAYQEAKRHYECKAKVDDGQGGTGWKFFECREEMRVWKAQK